MAGSAQSNDSEITGINVTPLVDIMLVLLIIFMVTATQLVKQATIEVELPKAASGGESTAQTLAIVIQKAGKVFVNGVEMEEDSLIRKIQDTPGKKEEMQAIISADTGAMHGSVVHMLDVLKIQGITRFAIQIEKQEAPATP